MIRSLLPSSVVLIFLALDGASFGFAATAVILKAPATSVFGSPVVLTASVNSEGASGKVAFYDGTALLGSASLSSGSATITVTLTETGRRSLSALFMGSPQYTPGQSNPVIHMVNSAPAFTFAPSLVCRSAESNTAVGDFNNDGLPDLVSAGHYAIAVCLGSGKGTFGSPIVTEGTWSDEDSFYIAVADFNFDGKLDVVTANCPFDQSGQNIAVRLGKGDGTFSAPSYYPMRSGPLAIADFNGDGIPDVAVGQGNAHSIAVRLGKKDGTLENALDIPLSIMSPKLLLIAGDVNQDGKTDLVVVSRQFFGSSSGTAINTLLGNGDGTFALPALSQKDDVDATQDPGSIALKDLNGDNVLDLAIQNGFNYKDGRCSVSTMLGAGNGRFQTPAHHLCSEVERASGSGTPMGMVIGDFDGDGTEDIAAVFRFSQPFTHLFRGNGDGTFQFAAVYVNPDVLTPQVGLAAADFNGDGRIDLVSSSRMSSTLMLGAPGPSLRLAIKHEGELSFGQSKARFTITVSNAVGALATNGTVSVNFFSSSASGQGWTCSWQTCTRSDSLAGGSSYPPITVLIDIGNSGSSTLITRSSVSGGGSAGMEAADTVQLNPRMEITSVTTTGASSLVSPNDWIEIKGANLVPKGTPGTGVDWSNSPEFTFGRMPTELNGVSVTVNKKQAYIYFYCSAATSKVCDVDQINVLTPPDDGLQGLAEIEVSANGTRASFTTVASSVSPSLLRFGATRYVTATHADYSLLGPLTLYPGLSSPARPGETVILWGVGFGLPASPLTAGAASQWGNLPEVPVCTLAGLPVTVSANLVSPGLYQINMGIPPDAPVGDSLILCSYRSVGTPSGLITVER